MRVRKQRPQLLELQHIFLPPELWREILARLPPKTLLRFRCVCKNWCSLIDSGDFVYTHLNLYRNNSAKTQLLVEEHVRNTIFDVIYTIRRSDTFRKIAQLVKDSETRMMYRSCMIHGLMLMDFQGKLNWNLSDSDDLCLWNPSIRKSVTLPLCPLRCTFYASRCFLGFAPSSNDYKVVTFDLIDSTAFELGIAVYSLGDHLWKVKHNKLKIPRWCYELLQCRCVAVFVQGAIYWRPLHIRWHGEDTELFSFDFDAEELRVLKVPNIDKEMYRLLFDFGGSLAFFGISSVTSCIWVLEKNAGNELWQQCWIRDTNVDVYQFFHDGTKRDYEISYIEDTGTLLIQSFRRLMAYNIRSNQTQILGKSIPLSYVENYVESLVLHKGFEGAASTSVA